MNNREIASVRDAYDSSSSSSAAAAAAADGELS